MPSLSAPSRGNVAPARCRTNPLPTTPALCAALAVAMILTGIARIAAADSPASQPSEITYSVDFFAPIFETREGQPTADASFQADLSEIIGDTNVVLGISDAGYIAPGNNTPTANRKISELNIEGAAQFSQGAILAIDKAIVRTLNAHGYGAVLVVPSPNDIDPQDLSDLRSRH